MSHPTARPSLEARLYGCWLGKSIGGTLGIPAEGRRERLAFEFYDPVPAVPPPNDDLELQLVWLHLAEQTGRELTRRDFATGWKRHIHYMWDEYGRCRWNLRRGVPLEANGVFENAFAAGMGSPIRSEIWSCQFPGDSASAGYYAALDASLDHGVEGIAGEVFFAAMQSEVAAGAELIHGIEAALTRIPASSETARAVELVLKNAPSCSVWRCREQLLAAHDSDNFTHAPLNVALTVWALLYGAGDFGDSILLAVNGGYDTDCTAATTGATLGLISGVDGIPDKWRRPIGDQVAVGPGIREINPPGTIRELTERTGALLGKLPRKTWVDISWDRPTAAVDLKTLPGTIHVAPFGGGVSQAWANGELPESVKRSGGADWAWHVHEDAVVVLVCLATAGATLSIDGKAVIECPAALPYVPATHRCPDQARCRVRISRGVHAVRVKLGAKTADQHASVLLAYPNLHLAPWTAAELPEIALLPETEKYGRVGEIAL